MDNSAALKNGAIQARKLIDNHILNEIMIPMAQSMLELTYMHRFSVGHNMTGNTINAYVAILFANGKKMWDSYSSYGVEPSIREKLSTGDVFYADDTRWDGMEQGGNFKASVPTDRDFEPDSQTKKFANSYKSQIQGWELVICNAIEYASFQEIELKVDVLSNSFSNFEMMHKSYFKPIA